MAKSNVFGVQDITVLYAGGRLAGTPQLYDSGALHAIERELIGKESDEFHYVRLPVVAALYKPVTFLTYVQAMVIWKFLTVIGFVSLAWILPLPGKRAALLATAASLGAFNALLLGQDVWIVMLAIAAFVYLMDKGKDRTAGALLGFAVLLKYHIFPFAILALLLHRKWRAVSMAGAVTAAGILVSFVLQGTSWPTQYASLLMSKGAVAAMYMPNIAGLAATSGFGMPAYVLLLAMAAAGVVIMARRSSAQFAFGVAMFAGVLAAPHGYLYDFVIFLPALLPIAANHPWFESRAAFWLLPFPAVPLLAGMGLWGQVLIVCAAAETLYFASQFAVKEQSRLNATTELSR
ncbi:MAG: glycosyltransferase family 87 protein [Acidobacteriota bacterium]